MRRVRTETWLYVIAGIAVFIFFAALGALLIFSKPTQRLAVQNRGRVAVTPETPASRQSARLPSPAHDVSDLYPRGPEYESDQPSNSPNREFDGTRWEYKDITKGVVVAITFERTTVEYDYIAHFTFTPDHAVTGEEAANLQPQDCKARIWELSVVLATPDNKPVADGYADNDMLTLHLDDDAFKRIQ